MTLSDSNFDKAFNYAIRILSQRDYSIFKMKEKLHSKKFKSEHISEVIEKLLANNYLREEEYTNGRIKQLLFKGYSNNYILQKLELEHLQLSIHLIDSIRESNDLATDKQIKKLIVEKLGKNQIPSEYEDRMKLKNKVLTFMASRGYDYFEVQDQMSRYIE